MSTENRIGTMLGGTRVLPIKQINGRRVEVNLGSPAIEALDPEDAATAILRYALKTGRNVSLTNVDSLNA